MRSARGPSFALPETFDQSSRTPAQKARPQTPLLSHPQLPTPGTRVRDDGEPPPPAPRKRLKPGIATYSYCNFKTDKVPNETVSHKAAEPGVEGLYILHRHIDPPQRDPLTSQHRAYLQKLKRHAFRNGVAPA